jgi:Transposase, Mutator family
VTASELAFAAPFGRKGLSAHWILQVFAASKQRGARCAGAALRTFPMNFQSSGRWRSQRASRTSPAISSPSCALVRFEAILRKLARRGLRGVKLVVSDAHEGIKATVGKVLNATWQRCRVHFMRNALAHAGKSGRRVVSAFIATAFAQDDAEAARTQWRRVADQLRPKLARCRYAPAERCRFRRARVVVNRRGASTPIDFASEGQSWAPTG